MKLTIISGRSGSGKSTALRTLEDAGYHCVDNLPVNLLQSLVDQALRVPFARDGNMAVCIDARTTGLEHFPEIVGALNDAGLACEVIYLDASNATLVRRTSETRRKHPLTDANTDLPQAIEAETCLLEHIAGLADLKIDTSHLLAQELIESIRERVVARVHAGVSLLFRSFGFRFGVPPDSDMVFDLRCLPNPNWVPALRPLTGLDEPVQAHLSEGAPVKHMFEDISSHLETWLPRFEENNRAYVTVSLGCTGGQHRSVYMAERLGLYFGERYVNVLIRHRELGRSP